MGGCSCESHPVGKCAWVPDTYPADKVAHALSQPVVVAKQNEETIYLSWHTRTSSVDEGKQSAGVLYVAGS